MQTKNYLNITQKINQSKLNCLDTSKYKTKTYTSYYSYKYSEYYSDIGGYVWSPKKTKNSIYTNHYIRI